MAPLNATTKLIALLTALLAGLGAGMLLGPAIEAAPFAGEAPQRVLCSCIPPPPPPEARDVADAVFEGRVTAIRRVGDPAFGQLEVTLDVKQVWGKADVPSPVVVFTSVDSAMCGFHFEMDKVYIVYAIRGGGEDPADPRGPLETTNCSRTRLFDAEEAAALGPSRPPVTLTSPTSTARPTPLPSVTPWPSPTAAACPDCPTPLPPRQAMNAADLVFVGVVEARTELPAEDWQLELRFLVEKTWTSRGAAERLTLRLPWAVWSCEGAPHVGEKWLVYADQRADGRLTYGLCGRSHELLDPDSDLAELGDGCDPVSELVLTASPEVIRAGDMFTVGLQTRGLLIMEIKSVSIEPPGMAVLEPPLTFPCSPAGGDCPLRFRALQPGLLRIEVGAFGEYVFCERGNIGYSWAHPSASIALSIGEAGAVTPTVTTNPIPPSATPTVDAVHRLSLPALLRNTALR